MIGAQRVGDPASRVPRSTWFVTGMPSGWSGMKCAAGHEGCRIPAGWDPEHSDQQTPYTLDQLAARKQPPHPGAYPDHHEYLFGWKLWTALQRDSRLTAAESAVVQPVKNRMLAEKLAAGMPGYTVEELLELMNRRGRCG